MNFRKLTKREQLILYATLIFLGFILLGIGLIRPILIKVKEVNQKIDTKTKLLKRYMGIMNNKDQILSLYNSYRDILITEQTSEEIVASLFSSIENSAQRFNITIERIRPRFVGVKKSYKEVILEVELKGKLASVFQFIVYLEKTSLSVRITSLRIIPGTDSSSLRCRVTLSKLFFD